MAASHLFSNKKNSKDPQHMNFGKHTGAGPWWALPWALVGPCGDRALSGPNKYVKDVRLHEGGHAVPHICFSVLRAPPLEGYLSD